jgi:hypothetical protein
MATATRSTWYRAWVAGWAHTLPTTGHAAPKRQAGQGGTPGAALPALPPYRAAVAGARALVLYGPGVAVRQARRQHAARARVLGGNQPTLPGHGARTLRNLGYTWGVGNLPYSA